ncbi:NADH dehydrogenase [Haladaptatus sp. W1]|uniref:NADH-quinone oxidoreductase subunit J n=1 Tax=Haladaptatus sp. W1 TaxID=1897478 RepID=UPI0008499278|nr:NADH-quinone oxidoreductase subunit J [Haladaptatus sp. W1]ODR80441.1 NADH dehydrogenase [Haladaptatus sp. W1]
MTSRPRMRDPSTMLPGVVAVALFAILAVVFLGASFGDAGGFGAGANITASIGYAMFNIGNVGGDALVQSEGFLVAFEIIDLVLVAALVGAVMLASRDDGESGDNGTSSAVMADGGRNAGGDEE